MTGRGCLAWLAAFGLLIFGVPVLFFTLLGVVSGSTEFVVVLVLLAVAATGIGVLLFRWAMGPWREKRRLWAEELPDGLSRGQKQAAVLGLQQRDVRADGIADMEERHADLIAELRASGHDPDVMASWTTGNADVPSRWDFYLRCPRFGRQHRRPPIRRSVWLRPAQPCID